MIQALETMKKATQVANTGCCRGSGGGYGCPGDGRCCIRAEIRYAFGCHSVVVQYCASRRGCRTGCARLRGVVEDGVEIH
jgi:hypothetical protein